MTGFKQKVFIINYKKWVINIVFGREQRKVHWRLIIAPLWTLPLERAHWDSSNTIAKSCTTTLKEAAYVSRVIFDLRENKEKLVGDSLSLHCEHLPITRKSSSRRFYHHCRRLHDNIKRGCTCRQSNDLENKLNKITWGEHIMLSISYLYLIN
jgi:hypothetical protein